MSSEYDESITLKEKYIQYNTKANIINGILAMTAFNLVNPYFPKFAERLGATDYQIAYLSSLPHLISIFAFIPGAILIENFRDKKKTTGIIMLIHKFFYLMLVLVPFFNNDNKASLFVALVGLMNLPGSIGKMGYQSCIGDVFLPEDRGKAMGLRQRYATIGGILITFLSGELLTRVPQNNKETIQLYQIFFFIAFLLSLGEIIAFSKLRGVKKKTKKNTNYIYELKKTLKNIPNEKDFIIFSLCSIFFHIGWMGAQPLFSIYMIKILKADEIWLSATSIASGISATLAYTKWAKFGKKKGNDLALSIAIVGMGITPILYAVSSSLKALVIYNILIGISVAGTTLFLFNILLEVIPNENRTIYIALYNTFVAIISGIAPILSVKIMNMTNIKIALIIIATLRLIASVFFFLREKHA